MINEKTIDPRDTFVLADENDPQSYARLRRFNDRQAQTKPERRGSNLGKNILGGIGAVALTSAVFAIAGSEIRGHGDAAMAPAAPLVAHNNAAARSTVTPEMQGLGEVNGIAPLAGTSEATPTK